MKNFTNLLIAFLRLLFFKKAMEYQVLKWWCTILIGCSIRLWKAVLDVLQGHMQP